MAPTEATILTNFLLPPAPLPSVLTLRKFTTFFPPSQASNPQIRLLYRDLQHQRALLTDGVAQNISNEVKRGNAQRRAVVKARREAERSEQDEDEEIHIENALFGQTSNLPSRKPHTIDSILNDMEAAARDVEDEIRKLEEEAASVLAEIEGTVDGLSDLRYGKLANAELPQEVLEQLKGLERICDK